MVSLEPSTIATTTSTSRFVLKHRLIAFVAPLRDRSFFYSLTLPSVRMSVCGLRLATRWRWAVIRLSLCSCSHVRSIAPTHSWLFQSSYTCKGGASETWTPRWTYTGYRYAELHGHNWSVPTTDTMSQVVVHSDVEGAPIPLSAQATPRVLAGSIALGGTEHGEGRR